MKNYSILFLSVALSLAACHTVKNSGEFPADTEWKLIELEGNAVPDNVQATIRFETATKRYSGNDSCNSYFGTYEVAAETLKLGAAGATIKYCSEVANWETAYLQMLPKVDGYAYEDGKLKLKAGAVILAVYEQ
jgi:heat shock protein HslJ